MSKTHHTVVDGISGMDVLSVLFAPDEEAPDEAEPWRADAPPSGVELLGQALLDRVTQPAELVRPVRALLRRPARVLAADGKTESRATDRFPGAAPAVSPRTRSRRSATVIPGRR